MESRKPGSTLSPSSVSKLKPAKRKKKELLDDKLISIHVEIPGIDYLLIATLYLVET